MAPFSCGKGGGYSTVLLGPRPPMALENRVDKLITITQMPSGQGKKRASLFWLVEFKGNPSPTKGQKGTTGQLG